ncbi:phage ORF5 protein [Shewanella sp.]|uniref:phage ORF5 protein n=1 Tax=Shewanella sp. TaxID=50422 RepID=UPI004047356B
MIMKVFAIFDSAVGAYLPPFNMKEIGEVERALKGHCNDPLHNFYKHGSDFTLFQLGTFDDTSAVYDLLITPHRISGLHEYQSQQGSGGVAPQQ